MFIPFHSIYFLLLLERRTKTSKSQPALQYCTFIYNLRHYNYTLRISFFILP